MECHFHDDDENDDDNDNDDEIFILIQQYVVSLRHALSAYVYFCIDLLTYLISQSKFLHRLTCYTYPNFNP